MRPSLVAEDEALQLVADMRAEAAAEENSARVVDATENIDASAWLPVIEASMNHFVIDVGTDADGGLKLARYRAASS